MNENARGYEMDEVCYIHKSEEIRREEIPAKIGNVMELADKIKAFMARDKKGAMVIPAEELEQHDTALFQNHIIGEGDPLLLYSPGDIMTGFKVDRATGKVIVKKLYRFRGDYLMETRTYLIRNYGKTWRAWTAMPDERKARWD